LPRQRFCRRCGAPVAGPTSGEVPTKVFRPEPEATDEASLLTSPLGATPVTDRVSQQPTAYTPTPSPRPVVPLSTLQPAKSSWMRFLPLILIGVVGVSLLGGLVLSRLIRRSVLVKKSSTAAPAAPPPVKVIVNPPERPAAGLMNEEGAVISDDKTTITQSYPLGANALVSLSNVTGHISIEGWDEAQAEVKVIKDGGSAEDRQAVQVRLASTKELLSIETSPTRSSPVEVHYEIRLPRRVRQIEIKSADSEVKLVKITGEVSVNVQGSSIEMEDVSGPLHTKIVKGDTQATLSSAPSGPLEFSSVSGDIELRLDGNINADITAETIDGEIDADDELKLKVEKRPMGQSVTGRIGTGGMSIRIKTINGDIKLKK
jgi:hypothetical protein